MLSINWSAICEAFQNRPSSNSIEHPRVLHSIQAVRTLRACIGCGSLDTGQRKLSLPRTELLVEVACSRRWIVDRSSRRCVSVAFRSARSRRKKNRSDSLAA